MIAIHHQLSSSLVHTLHVFLYDVTCSILFLFCAFINCYYTKHRARMAVVVNVWNTYSSFFCRRSSAEKSGSRKRAGLKRVSSYTYTSVEIATYDFDGWDFFYLRRKIFPHFVYVWSFNKFNVENKYLASFAREISHLFDIIYSRLVSMIKIENRFIS